MAYNPGVVKGMSANILIPMMSLFFCCVIIEFNNRSICHRGCFSGGLEFKDKLDLDPYRGIIIADVRKVHIL